VLDLIRPDWPARVGALFTTATMGDMATEEARARLRSLLPGEPRWLHQVHGARIVATDDATAPPKADASYTHTRGTVCVVKIADCMPVLLADEAASVVAAAHAGWRGLAAGVLEATVDAMRAPAGELYACSGRQSGRAFTRLARTYAPRSASRRVLFAQRARGIGCSISTRWRGQDLKVRVCGASTAAAIAPTPSASVSFRTAATAANAAWPRQFGYRRSAA